MALACVTHAVNWTVLNEPHENVTHGGDGACEAALCSVTSQHDSSSSTCLRTVSAPGVPEASRNRSTRSCAGSTPVNFGGAPRV
ncbi:hypothetical protein GCM10009731_65100 [Streptomyces globosus]